MTKTVALIPARGGSRRIPRKNLLPLAGKPLLSYTIDAAVQSGVFDDIVVSSDDEDILSLARAWDVTVDVRPESLRGDAIRTDDVAAEFATRPEIQARFDSLAVMLPTCPFRSLDDVQGAYHLFQRHAGAIWVIGITEYDFPPQFALSLGDDGTSITPQDPVAYQIVTSQLLEKFYRPNGSIYLAPTRKLAQEKTLFGSPLHGYIMPLERSFDIDYPVQLQFADYLMRQRLDSQA